jgi:hypothetical protein
MSGWAIVDRRGRKIFVTSYSQATRSTIINGWIEVVDRSLNDAALGKVVRAALAQSQRGVPFPDFGKGDTPELRKLLDVAGVRSYSAYVRGVRSVRVALDDEEPGFVIIPFKNEGAQGGFIPLMNETMRADAAVEDGSLGEVVRVALERAQ